MDGDSSVDKREWQEVVAKLAFAALERIPTEVYIAALPLRSRPTLKALIEQWCTKEDARGSLPGVNRITADSEDEFSTARFCWAIHTEKTARELLGGITEIENIGEVVYCARLDPSAERFGGMIEQCTLELIVELLSFSTDKAAEGKAALHMRVPENPSSRGGLLPDEPFVILCVAQKPSLAEVASWRRSRPTASSNALTLTP